MLERGLVKPDGSGDGGGQVVTEVADTARRATRSGAHLLFATTATGKPTEMDKESWKPTEMDSMGKKEIL